MQEGWESLQRLASFLVPSLAIPAAVQPVAALGTILAIVVTTGIALASLATFLTAAFFVYLLVTQVLGIEIRVSL